MAKVVWTQPALNDVCAAFDYLVRKSRSLDMAERVSLELLDAAYDRIPRMPNAGAIVEELKHIGAREIFKHSYRIIYVQRGDVCYVIQCIHSSRDLIRHIDPERWSDILLDEEES